MEEKKINITYIILLVLTGLTALIASNKSLVSVVMLIAVIKFWLVAFQFMELKKANGFWKFLIIFFGILVAGIIILVI